ncbi:unnamed protein product [Rhizophagus irregularis]|uniref:Uncharacterized protein n=1 Tax=Rhizophagus irregularis TaxID=588596 RepID=A0A2I1H086_9GLOM|nr:hypothetical protein RhiirA4_469736 [Rhizophagus irregularis]CAB4415695.1 unnamed protein product [Rhizophagus irregularis]
MSSQNNNQPPHKIFKTTREPDKLLGGTPRQARKINELEKVENKAEPTLTGQSRDATCGCSSSGSIEEINVSTFTPIPSTQIQGILEVHDFDWPNSALLDMGSKDGRTSPGLTFSRYSSKHYAKIPLILNDPQTYDNGELGHQTNDGRSSSSHPFFNHFTSILNDPQTYDNDGSHQTHDERASVTIPNPQTHVGRTSINPQTHGKRVSSSLTLLRYSFNYYARIPSTLNGSQTLPSFPWFLNNPNENNDVSLPPIYNNSTPQQIHLRTLEPVHKPEDPELPFRL